MKQASSNSRQALSRAAAFDSPALACCRVADPVQGTNPGAGRVERLRPHNAAKLVRWRQPVCRAVTACWPATSNTAPNLAPTSSDWRVELADAASDGMLGSPRPVPQQPAVAAARVRASAKVGEARATAAI